MICFLSIIKICEGFNNCDDFIGEPSESEYDLSIENTIPDMKTTHSGRFEIFRRPKIFLDVNGFERLYFKKLSIYFKK